MGGLAGYRPGGARHFCSRLEHEFGLAYRSHGLSIGIAQANGGNTDVNVDELLRAADKNMYAAKEKRREGGRRRVSPPEKKES